MTAHLLLITLGPVQDFIAQARRTRDHWYGSHLLSELARAAARTMIAGGARLIFPALEQGDEELDPCQAPLRSNGIPPLSIGNKLLAEVPAEIDAADLARATRDSVRSFWRDDIAARVRQDCVGLLANDIDAAWVEQIDSCLEFLATWAPNVDYQIARRSVEQAIAARKNLRDFQPWHNVRGHVPKSSLDGARETVLRHHSQRDVRLAQKYRIAEREQLDAVGLVKRAGGKPEQFVSIVNVAFGPWLDLARQEAPGALEDLKTACRQTGVSRIERDLPCTAHFKFDAEIFLPSRWNAIFEHQEPNGDTRTWGRRYVQPVLSKLKDPYPYVACLAADGDRMGAVIGALRTADAHRLLSAALAKFAEKARDIVEQSHGGTLIYAGGDDVLAFVPLPTVLACAEELRQTFADSMARSLPQLSPAESPTLSVGVGIGHIMEGMGDLLALGREAERCAKTGGENATKRNALAIIVDKRSGAKRSWRSQWDDRKGNPVARLQADIQVLQQRLSSRKLYEIADRLKRMPDPEQVDDLAWVRPIVLEVRNLLARVDAGATSIDSDTVGLSLDESLDYSGLHTEISAWVDRMIVARAFADAIPQLRHAEVATA